MKNLMFVPVLCASIGFSLASSASATNLGVANDYNLFVFGNFSPSGSSDSEGNVAVGGNAEIIPSYTVAGEISGNLAKFIVNGNLTWTSDGSIGQGSQGTAYVGGTANILSYRKLNNTQNIVDFPAAEKYLTQASSVWNNQKTNGDIDWDSTTLNLTGTSSTLNVFNVKAANVDVDTLSISAPAHSTVLVNVSGSDVSMDGLYNYGFGMKLNGVTANNVLFNFCDATSLRLYGCGFEGSILAPSASVDFSNGQINGTFIANSMTGSGEFHNVQFQGDLPNVPEPGTVLLLLTGAVLFIRTKIA
jgi:choice-of-anchor A domain-containing protein